MSLRLYEMIRACNNVENMRDTRIQISQHDLKIIGKRVNDGETFAVAAIWNVNKSADQVFYEALHRFKQYAKG